MKIMLIKPLVAIVLILCAACGGELSEESVQEDPTPSIEDALVEGTAIGKSVLKKLTPSLVTIQFRDRDIGSGFIVEGNYVVTAAHVVWGLPEIDVVFHDGTVRRDVSIAGYDHFADLAFLGPVDASAPPVVFSEAESLATEDTVFNVGNTKQLGGLSVTKGEFTRTSEWPEADVTFVYSSAEAKPGMSGGLAVNERGEVIRVNVAGDERGSVGPSSETVKDRLGKLARGEDITVLGSRELPDIRDGSREHQFVLRDRWDGVLAIFRMRT